MCAAAVPASERPRVYAVVFLFFCGLVRLAAVVSFAF